MEKGKFGNTEPRILNDLRLGDPIVGPMPKTRIIGSDRKEDLTQLPQIQKFDHTWEAYKEYNANIGEHPTYIDKFTPRDNHILIKCFKYETDRTTEGGLILNNDVEWIETPGGQRVMRTSSNPYQKRAIIIKRGHLGVDNTFHDLLTEGTIVTLSTNKLENGKFDTKPERKGSVDLGYFLIHVGLITGIESV